MPILILSDPMHLCDVNTTHDIYFPKTSKVYSKVETRESLCVSGDVTFYNDVRCRSLVVAEDARAIFKKDLHCDALESAGSLSVEGDLRAAKAISYQGSFVCNNVFLRGCRVSSVQPEQPLQPLAKAILQESSTQDVVFIDPEPERDIVGVCEDCRVEGPVQTICGDDGSRLSICFSCATSIINPPQQSLPVVFERRIPSTWELTNSMTEDEKEFFATNGYVTFEERLPDKPFITIKPESQNGVLRYKELSICDPDNKYLSEDEADSLTLRLRYNGGPTAGLIQGTLSATSLISCLSLLGGPIGVGGALAVWAVTTPLSWKFSKFATNVINEAVVLPGEIKKREELIEARRKDEQVNHDIHRETV